MQASRSTRPRSRATRALLAEYCRGVRATSAEGLSAQSSASEKNAATAAGATKATVRTGASLVRSGEHPSIRLLPTSSTASRHGFAVKRRGRWPLTRTLGSAVNRSRVNGPGR
eukprot:1230569-Prymnesium_polylepis.1